MLQKIYKWKKFPIWGASSIEETKQKAPVEVYRDDWNVLTESMSYETRTHVLSLTFQYTLFLLSLFLVF